jgi:hypothetical protein
MKNIFLTLVVSFLFFGCNSKAVDSDVVQKLKIGSQLNLELNNQFGQKYKLQDGVNRVIFAFSKDSAHICNDYFDRQKADFLDQHHTLFVADVSSAPSIIRSMFIMPGLKDFKHNVLIFEDKKDAIGYKKGMDIEKIIIVYLKNRKIVDIKRVSTIEELEIEITQS